MPGGMPGMPGAAPGMPGAAPGMPGAPTMPGGKGAGGGQPAMPGGAGFQGGAGMSGMPGGTGMGRLLINRNEDEPESAELFVGVILEAKKSDIRVDKETGRMHVKHRWGETSLYFGPDIEVSHYKMPTVLQRYEEELKKVNQESSDKVAKLLELADWAMAHGLYKEVPKLVGEIARIDPKHRVVVAFQNVEKAMTREIAQDDAGLKWWREKLGDLEEKKSPHYTLLTDVKMTKEVQQRLDRLEENYTGFFYWFALRGLELPVPQKRLMAVLLRLTDAFKQKHTEVFDGEPLVADGFFARRENLAVFSSDRLDEQFEALKKHVKGEFEKRNWSEEELLAGKGRRANTTANEVPYVQTLALIHTGMRDEAERATVSYEGTRQLIAAVGLLPRSVQAPQWIDFGMASFFETSKEMAFWPGIGTPNLTYLKNFKLWDGAHGLERNAAKALKAVVTDELFRAITSSKNKEAATAKARTMTWSLVFFLAKKHSAGLLAYYNQLATMPRDLEFDADTQLLAFARAFGLMDQAKPDQVDQSAVARLASEWYQYTRLVQFEVEEAYQKAKEKYKQKLPNPTTTASGKPPAAGGGKQ
jgi:hypothetical protein